MMLPPTPSQPPSDAPNGNGALPGSQALLPTETTTATETPEATRLMRQLVEHLPVGMVVIDTATYQIVFVNRMARELYERYSHNPAAMLYRLSVQEALSWVPSDPDQLLRQLNQVASSHCPIYDQLLEVGEIAASTAHGNLPEMCWAYDLVPLESLENAGQPSTQVLVTFRDHTAQMHERQRAEAALFSAQLRTEMLEAIIEQIAEAVIVRDREGKLVVYNREALAFASNRTEVERARIRGSRVAPAWEMLNSEGKPLPRPELPEWRVMLTGASLLSDDVLVRKENGDTRPVLIHATPLRDEAGATAGAVMAFQDISVVKEEERLKDEYTSVASHELRQPITVIQGQAQMLKRHLRKLSDDATSALNPETLRKLADGVESQTTRLNLLVSELLDMSRIQAGQLRLNPTPMALVPLMLRLIELQQSASNDHLFLLKNLVPPQYGNLEGVWDASRIEQLLANLLNNAVKYSPAGGEIRVTLGVLPRGATLGPREAKERGRKKLLVENAHIAIQDQGIGIPADGLQHLFERFYRAPNTGGIQGTGLGLYICEQVVQMHQGAIWAESDGIGTGSTFHLALPLK